MKKYIILLFLVAFSGMNITAQSFSDDNFIYTSKPKKAVSVDYLKTLTKDEINQTITYFDGLGRPVQTIAIGQGGDGSDLITPIEYDGFGRQEKEYLPFSLPNPNNQYPRIETQTAIDNTISFYNNEKYGNTTNPFSQKKFEDSPLNRVLKQAAPGNDWALGNGHEIKIDYQTNSTGEVRLFEAITIWDQTAGLYDISFWDNGYYDKNELYKTITYDENSSSNPSEKQGSTIEFKNKEGQVVLKRTYESGVEHDTYYVYDEYGNLTYVIPPKADEVITDETLNNLCYQYKYDHRNRLVEKKLPGRQWEFIVYDRLDRVVATGPSNSPFQDDNAIGWLITKYDIYSRQIYTGWDSTSCNAVARYTLQQAQNTATILYESRQSSGTIDGIPTHYTNTIFPTSFKLLTVNYYDSKGYPNEVYMTPDVNQPMFSNLKGLLTGSWTRVPTTVSSGLGETSTLAYDDKRRIIRNYSTNHLGGSLSISYRLDFEGKITSKGGPHVGFSGANSLRITEDFTYSPQNRLLTHTHMMYGAQPQLLMNNTYDALGQLISKKVGSTIASPLQKIDYKYNIRGWLTDINSTDNLQQDNDPKDLFAFKINYNKVEGNTAAAQELYNGNIAETYWATGNNGAGVLRGYGYKYDQLNRLKDATYQTPKLTDNKNYFGENLDYDKNGNITRLQRKFMAGVSNNPYADDMDNLDYFYANDSNQLMKVTDKTNNPQGFKDDSDGYNDSEDDYEYDDNGNLTKDQNKNITQITYNHLNLPKKITFASGNTIVYIYNATGEKVEKIVTDNGVVTNTKYLSGFQYKNDVLDFFPTAEGYVKSSPVYGGNSYRYVFNYTDHLGNVRLSYAQNAKNTGLEILEENNYYPFGLKHQGYNTDNLQPNYRYRYNGKELQDELSLNLYDYGARNYDPALGRWLNIDPLAEKMRRHSPYNYAFNNPIRFIDPDGMAPDWHRDGAGALVADAGDTAETLAQYTGSSVQEARAEFNHNNYRYESVMSGGETFNNSEKHVSSGDYGTDKNFGHAVAFASVVALPVMGATGIFGAAFGAPTLGSATLGVSTNVAAQGVANGGDLTKVNMIEAASAAVPGIGPAVIGGTFNFNIAEADQGIQTPKSFEHAVIQIGGAALATKFGQKIDASPILGSAAKGVGNVYGNVAKTAATAVADTAPKLVDQVQKK